MTHLNICIVYFWDKILAWRTQAVIWGARPQNGPREARPGFNPHNGHVVESLYQTLYNDYLCLVASNKQQIQLAKIQRNPSEHWKLLSRQKFVQALSNLTFFYKKKVK